jgi:ubiquinone/menaquinone biosynthesis C-methylase UbiE
MNKSNRHEAELGDDMNRTRAEVWKSAKLARRFLTGVRGAIPLAQTQIEVMLRLLAMRRKPVRRFLDLGCGDGVLGAAIWERYPSAAGTFVDFSEPMLAACRSKLPTNRATTLLLDYGKPAWVEAVAGKGPFDAIVSGFSIHHQPDRRKRALYREIFRLLGPGGWFVNIEHVAPANPTTSVLFDDAMIESIHRQQPQSSRAAVRRRFVTRADRSANILAPVENQCRWLRAIGFAEVDCYFKIYELAVFGGQKPK